MNTLLGPETTLGLLDHKIPRWLSSCSSRGTGGGFWGPGAGVQSLVGAVSRHTAGATSPVGCQALCLVVSWWGAPVRWRGRDLALVVV